MKKNENRGLPEWLDNVNTYCMLPVTPKEASAMHVTVNGLWAGFCGDNPILPFNEFISTVVSAFGDDAVAFADACHNAGIVVCSAIYGTEGFEFLRNRYPELDACTCRDADGKVAGWGGNQKIHVMCVNNPSWLQWEIDFGRKGIDSGADLVLVDSPQSCGIAMSHAGAGYCDACLDNFKRYLESKYSPEQVREKFGMEGFNKLEILARCRMSTDADGKKVPYSVRVAADPLFKEYFDCQEKASFDTRKVLVDSLREYAKTRNRKIAVSTNAYYLGSLNPYGYWIRSLMFTDLFDLFTYEFSYSSTGFPHHDVKLPRGKWAPFHKLAHALRGRREVALVPAVSIGNALRDSPQGQLRMNTWLGVLSAEAYAANGANTLYYFEDPLGDTSLREMVWAKSIEFTGFVLKHKDLFEGELRAGSPLAVLFLNSERGRDIPSVYPSYLGFSQALIEGSYPFDVLFAGDGRYVKDRLTANDLRLYETVFIPSPIDPTENQISIIKEFVTNGGHLICQELEHFRIKAEITPADSGFVEGTCSYGQGQLTRVRGDVTETWTHDIASNFFKDYDPRLRDQLLSFVDGIGLRPVSGAEDQRGLVSAFPILQPDKERLVVHVVNYDVDFETDAIRVKENIPISVSRPRFLRGDVRCMLYSPGRDFAEELNVVISDDSIYCLVQELGMFASVVFTGL